VRGSLITTPPQKGLQPGLVYLRLAAIEPLALALHKVRTATWALAQATATD